MDTYVLLQKHETLDNVRAIRVYVHRTQGAIVAQFGQAAWDKKQVILGYRNGKPVVCSIVLHTDSKFYIDVRGGKTEIVNR